MLRYVKSSFKMIVMKVHYHIVWMMGEISSFKFLIIIDTNAKIKVVMFRNEYKC
ncbi:MAG: hypothetical protein Nk1A_7550 [Endomicrobiia bacterium]|nr:MAG: hypothetical protein Nk1A_7550 [Endomicrobiia bacterium]